jgi:hypothetical protein
MKGLSDEIPLLLCIQLYLNFLLLSLFNRTNSLSLWVAQLPTVVTSLATMPTSKPWILVDGVGKFHSL